MLSGAGPLSSLSSRVAAVVGGSKPESVIEGVLSVFSDAPPSPRGHF